MLYEFRKGVSVGDHKQTIRTFIWTGHLLYGTVKKWFSRFRNGDFNMDDQPRSGRPSAIEDDIVSA